MSRSSPPVWILLALTALALVVVIGALRPRLRLGYESGLVVAPASSAVAPEPNVRPAVPPTDSSWAPDDTLGFPFLPDTGLTPGAVLPVTRKDICLPGYTRKVRNVPVAVKRRVFRAYGILRHEPWEYEVDHLISLELGGSNSIRNLWPQSYRTAPWNARVKDALENELHRRVCDGRMPLAEAQQMIARNWIRAYRRLIAPEPPARRRRGR